MPAHLGRNTQKGITLIALVITIIILLILAIVSIRLVVNNGILGKAEKGVNEYSQAEADEQEQLLKTEYEMAKYEQGYTGTYTDYVLDKKYNGLKIGDYVNYDPTDGATTTSVTSNEADNGYGDQTFQLASYKSAGYGWRVLGVENGKVQLISEEFIGPDEGGYTNETYNRTYYYLGGEAGYINGVDELNAICSMYGQGKGAEGARSITVEDVNKITGYDPKTAKYGEGQFYEYGNEVTYTRGDGDALSASGTNGQTWSGTQSTFKYYDEKTRSFVDLTAGKSVTLKSTYYYYEPTTLNVKNEEPTNGVDENYNYDTRLSMLFGDYKYYKTDYNSWNRTFTGSGARMDYWLASPCVRLSEYGPRYTLLDVYYGLVEIGGVYGDGKGFTDKGSNSCNGVRPVVSLKSDIQLEYNSTTQEWEIQ